ncbi:NAD(P)H dehydrogenase [quinone] 1-like [Pundamilia nyererei]|uniref:NAD(P)H dehydrogenase [quinone] 1-like n=1 Tax=Pundamilia nyererei TaxID=303518 RepID=A0A9Y3VSA9_9CICH|nr:PREDICTED: NAD(P)H dehydrogenase [quinone] 1-like [Pundamilia nyererei]
MGKPLPANSQTKAGNGILNYCGFQVFAPQIFWDPATGSPESRSSMLEGWRTRLQNLCGEATVYFAPLDYFDKEKGFLLKPEVKEKYASKESGLTVGIHMGKPLPANSQTKAAV